MKRCEDCKYYEPADAAYVGHAMLPSCAIQPFNLCPTICEGYTRKWWKFWRPQ